MSKLGAPMRATHGSQRKVRVRVAVRVRPRLRDEIAREDDVCVDGVGDSQIALCNRRTAEKLVYK